MRRSKPNNPKNNAKYQVSKQVQLSKALSWFLRHGATKEGFEISETGWVDGTLLLSHPKFKKYDLEQIREVVETNNKKRFELEEELGSWKIRAVQGHTIKTIKEEGLLEPILDTSKYPVCIHGTFKAPWTKFIRFQGLKRMGRNHIRKIRR